MSQSVTSARTERQMIKLALRECTNGQFAPIFASAVNFLSDVIGQRQFLTTVPFEIEPHSDEEIGAELLAVATEILREVESQGRGFASAARTIRSSEEILSEEGLSAWAQSTSELCGLIRNICTERKEPASNFHALEQAIDHFEELFERFTAAGSPEFSVATLVFSFSGTADIVKEASELICSNLDALRLGIDDLVDDNAMHPIKAPIAVGDLHYSSKHIQLCFDDATASGNAAKYRLLLQQLHALSARLNNTEFAQSGRQVDELRSELASEWRYVQANDLKNLPPLLAAIEDSLAALDADAKIRNFHAHRVLTELRASLQSLIDAASSRGKAQSLVGFDLLIPVLGVRTRVDELHTQVMEVVRKSLSGIAEREALLAGRTFVPTRIGWIVEACDEDAIELPCELNTPNDAAARANPHAENEQPVAHA